MFSICTTHTGISICIMMIATGGARGGGGGANPFILLHVMLKNYDTITKKKFLLICTCINSLGIAKSA